MLNILYVDYETIHKGDFVFDVPDGHDSCLLLLVHTPAAFLVGDELVDTPPNSVVFYKPRQRIYYRARENRYSNDWMRFKTDDAYIMKNAIPSGVPFLLSDPIFVHRLFQLLTEEHKNGGRTKYVITDKLVQVMFHKLSEVYAGSEPEPSIKNISDLRSMIYSAPNENWSVALMAERLNISVGHLEKIYKKSFGVSCIEDVIVSRVMLAKRHLENGEFCISEIISICGYNNPEHFYRQFKKVTGMTPRQYQTQLSDMTKRGV